MLVHLIRHGYTQGNLERRYIGITDEPLCSFGIEELKKRTYPPCERVYCSPMVRCIQTAEIVYPHATPTLVDGFREINFGNFEGKDYSELSKNAHYQAWIDSNGILPFPNGESREEFSKRTWDAFNRVVTGLNLSSIAMVVHGGTIMSTMERLKGSNYFDYQVKNGEYLTVSI